MASSTVFTPEEDRVILQCVSSGITKWSEIAKKIWGKNGKQCMDRWLNHLDPSRLSRGGWTPEEDVKLRQAHAQHGSKWNKIAAMLPGRSELAVKNRWWSLPKNVPATLNDSHRSTAPKPNLWKVSKPYVTTSAQPLAPPSSAMAKPMPFTQVRTDTSDRKRKAHNMQPFPKPMERVMQSMMQSRAKPMVPMSRGSVPMNHSSVPMKPMKPNALSARLSMAAPPPMNVSSMPTLPASNFYAAPAPKPPQPSAVLKIDASMSILPPPSAQIHTQDMKELAEAFVREEVERQKRNGVSICQAEQDMMRNAFLAGMQHSPDEKDQSSADLRWEFDQSESLDAMGFSFDENETDDFNALGTSFDGLIEGHGINPPAARRADPCIISGGLRTPVTGSSGTFTPFGFGHSFHGSTDAAAWSGINTSDIIDTDVNDMELSMSMLNMSLDVEESQDQIVSASDVAGNFGD